MKPSNCVIHASCSKLAGYYRVVCIIEHAFPQRKRKDVLHFSFQKSMFRKDEEFILIILTVGGVCIFKKQATNCILHLCCKNSCIINELTSSSEQRSDTAWMSAGPYVGVLSATSEPSVWLVSNRDEASAAIRILPEWWWTSNANSSRRNLQPAGPPFNHFKCRIHYNCWLSVLSKIRFPSM